MRFSAVCVLLIAFVSVAQGWWFIKTSVCYHSYGIGCFSNKSPFDNAHGFLPNSPSSINPTFWLYTKQNPTAKQILSYRSSYSIQRSNFRSTRDTKVIIHGYLSRGSKSWVTEMTKELLRKGDFNIIVVDWSSGARKLVYSQSVVNTRVVGAMLGEQIKALNSATRSKPSQFHLIGHSLGAHIAGYAGNRVPGIARISGLDPAGRHFEHTDKVVRLDSLDANFVDVIHTGTKFLNTGIRRASGNVDFYPNGGAKQPGCIFKRDLGKRGWTKYLDCSHARAIYLFTSSINTCKFKGHPCSSEYRYDRGLCNSCGSGCVYMGYDANQNLRAHGTYYLTTTSRKPYC